MRKVILYIAMSLDGYIADSDGSVNWLSGETGGAEDDGAYAAFIKEIDTVFMGRNTYDQIVTELSPDEWPYAGLMTYVITHRKLPSKADIKFIQGDPCDILREEKKKSGKGIWVCGGASIIQPLVRAGLIDEYDISIIPTVLGSGIRLWGETDREIKLKLVRTEVRDGITELVYVRRTGAD